MSLTFLWHDYETFGINPRRDRPAQFAAIRTDFELNPVGEPVELFCQPPDDYLPDPESILITGITPQHAKAKGVIEAEFARRIHAQLSASGTCGVGYNTLRFDDEVTRHLLWRNLYPAYDREWRNDCSRWDLLDVVRACHAFRPDGVAWPKREDGATSFKLGDLTAANQIGHSHAHDALSDVRATIDLARLIHKAQPRLFAHCLNLRKKAAVVEEIGPLDGRPFLHVSGMFGAARGHVAVVVALGWHPVNRNELAVWDLAYDPALLADLSADELRTRMFTKADELPDDAPRLPIKTIHINRSPVVVGNLKVLTPARAAEFGIDLDLARQHATRLPLGAALADKLKQAFSRKDDDFEGVRDVDEALYDGFVGDGDARLLARLRDMTPKQLTEAKPSFVDARLEEVFFRYRARNWPDSLSADERERWQQHRHERLHGEVAGYLNNNTLAPRLAALRETALSHAQRGWLTDLEQYATLMAQQSL